MIENRKKNVSRFKILKPSAVRNAMTRRYAPLGFLISKSESSILFPLDIKKYCPTQRCMGLDFGVVGHACFLVQNCEIASKTSLQAVIIKVFQAA